MRSSKPNHEMNQHDRFDGFEYLSSEIEKFIAACDLFSILLKSGKIVHYKPADKSAFGEWLEKNNVENIRKEKSK